jgi:predicted nicotinamide N-methyase
MAERGGSLAGLTVLEIGAGNGLCSLVAATLGANSVATDISIEALELIEMAADTSATSARLSTALFNMCLVNEPLPQADIVVIADLLYEKSLAFGAAARVAEAASRGTMVLVGTDPYREHRGTFVAEVERLAGLARSKPSLCEIQGKVRYPVLGGYSGRLSLVKVSSILLWRYL